jgi:Rv2258c-like winged HTH domain/Methyltransferase domain
MTTGVDPTSGAGAGEDERRDALADRLLTSLIESAELASVWLGLRLGLYEDLRSNGPATVAELATRAGVDARYAREWLEQQAVAGLLDVEDPTGNAEDRRYRLPAAHADVLLDADHPAHAGAAAWWMGSLAQVLQRVPDLYRSGQGLPYPEYGADCRVAIANFNRPMFVNDLAGWFAAVPELDARLRAEGARALDAGCGIGWSSISLARAYPSLRVDGIDSDEASIADAEGNAARAGVADEKVAETFTAPGDELERLNFAFSWWHCLPASRAETPSAAAGTALRPATVRQWAEQAGFASLRELPVDHDFWRFYELSG